MATSTRGARERLLDATIELVREHGVHGTGIAEVLERSGTARASVYHHFPGGKAELVAAATREAGDRMLARLLRDADATPAGHVDALVDLWLRMLRRSDFGLGCPVAAAAQAGDASPDLAATATEVFERWAVHLSASLEASGRSPADALDVAGFVVSAAEGALLRARGARSAEPLEQARRQLHRLVD